MVGMEAAFPDLQHLRSLLPPLESIQFELLRRGVWPGKFGTYFPDDGPLRRELYPKQLEFFKAGAVYYERLFMKANRVGGTTAGAFELTAHMTGMYPIWWQGRRFKGPVDCWLAGKTGKTTRDILQKEMLGDFGQLGTGMIPAHLLIGEPSRTHGIPEAYENFHVRHATGGISRAQFKSCEQGRQAFEGTQKHVVWIDEEPESDAQGIYAECVTRTMTIDDKGEKTSGMVFVTFTPLKGLTLFVKEYMEKAVIGDPAGKLMNAEKVWEQTDDHAVV